MRVSFALTAFTTGNPFWGDKITSIEYREGFGGFKGVKLMFPPICYGGDIVVRTNYCD